MKIGVFGDSYADKGYVNSNNSIWYNFLEHEHGHKITCWGESGSSILFSANLILQHAPDYDLVIWCLTTPGRFSLPHKVHGKTVHVTNAQARFNIGDIEIQKKHAVCIDYLKYIFDWDTENFVGSAIASYLRQLHKNILIIPCFPPPLNAQFNLYQLCKWEAEFYFPGKTIPEIYQQYRDLRPGHISQQNQQILANLLNKNLEPGIFQTQYDHFQPPTQPLQELFKKI